MSNKAGRDVSQRPRLMPANKFNSRNKYYIIAPGTSRVWFIHVPNQIYARLKRNEKKLQPTPNGKYMANIVVDALYFAQDQKKEVAFNNKKYKILILYLPSIPIKINSKSFNQDIEKTYKER